RELGDSTVQPASGGREGAQGLQERQEIRRLLTAPAALFLFTGCMEHLAVWKS
ncbi:unnamed protein product, partial [Ascophyllum nodosum]